MPSVSNKQANLMRIVCKSESFSRKIKISQKMGCKFYSEDMKLGVWKNPKKANVNVKKAVDFIVKNKTRQKKTIKSSTNKVSAISIDKLINFFRKSKKLNNGSDLSTSDLFNTLADFVETEQSSDHYYKYFKKLAQLEKEKNG